MENKLEDIKKKYRHNDYRHVYEVRAKEETEEDNDYYILEGKAVTFNDPTILFKSGNTEYKEIIDSHAFDNADISDVFLKFNHESSVMAAARTKNKTLELDVRKDGVYIKAKLLKSLKVAEELYLAVRSGLIDKMSFAFTIEEEDFNDLTNTWTVRKIDKVYDVAAVEVPAYDNTFIYARRKGEVEARLKEVEASKFELRKAYLSKLLEKF